MAGSPNERWREALEHHQAGRLADAEAIYLAILAGDPQQPDALHFLGLALHRMGRSEEALALMQRALAIDPARPSFHNNLGEVCRELGHLEEAIAHYRAALALHPDYPEAHNNLGLALYLADRPAEAQRHCERALALRPLYPQAHNNLGNCLHVLGHFEEAIAQHQQALALRPNDPPTLNSLGAAYCEKARFAEAGACFERALALDPALADAHWNTALLHLALGDYERGWPEYEWRWQTRRFEHTVRALSQPQWQGEPLAGRTILLHAEQGFGDTLFMARYLPLVAAQGGRRLLEGPAELRTLLGGEGWITRGEPLPAFDVHCPLLSLPLAFGTTLATIRAPKAYLTAPAEKQAAWRDRLAAEPPGVKVGLAWAGNRQRLGDDRRSIPFTLLDPLFKVPGIHFYSLQKPTNEKRADLRDWTSELHDFSDTAALIANLDLVISVDTAVAHLAGALGRPAWTLLEHYPCWRWGVQGEQSPWYPTMRLFRQAQPGNWTEPVAKLTAALPTVAAHP